MADTEPRRVAIVFRGDRALRENATADNPRLAPIFGALRDVGLNATPSVFSEDMVDEVRRELLAADLALVWVDPVTGSNDRATLDALLREAAQQGVLVSAHPDVILRMGTKEVLHQTRDLGWGSDVDLYRTLDELRERFPARLAAGGARVLKQYRGNGGIGVWKVELIDHTSTSPPRPDTPVRVQAARPRDDTTEDLPLNKFIERCTKYFGYSHGEGRLIDQPFQPRITEGLIRSYFVKNEVIGFCRQYPTGMSPADQAAADTPPPEPSRNVFGLPSAKTMFPPSDPAFATLKRNLETDWVPQMQALVDVDTTQLPLLWDADFLFGPRDTDGTDSYVLCEINASAVAPFPEQTPRKLAVAAASAINASRRGPEHRGT